MFHAGDDVHAVGKTSVCRMSHPCTALYIRTKMSHVKARGTRVREVVSHPCERLHHSDDRNILRA